MLYGISRHRGAKRRDAQVSREDHMKRVDIKSLPLTDLELWVQEQGEPKYRAQQLYQWMHEKQVDSLDAMSNIPDRLKQKIREQCKFTVLEQLACQVSKQDGTRKYLFALSDGNTVESVLMKYRHGYSVCISSQVGCRMGCAFCASSIGGFVRNLTPAEMLGQVYRVSADLGERVSNVVVMGTGEPLDNLRNLLVFLGMLTDENGLHISQRSVTVSTCGLVPQMKELAREHLAITLAVSLHAADQATREEIMPVAKTWDLEALFDACAYYFEETGRRVTLEYCLIRGVNDTGRDSALLGGWIANLNCHVNLIPVNPVREKNWHQPGREQVLTFKNKLEKYGRNVTIRREMGRDIDGACGQLRKGYSERVKQQR